MKVIHTADWHIGKRLNEYNLIEDQADYFNNLISMVEQENADALIIAGDLYDRAVPSTEAVALLNDVFTKLIRTGVKVFVIAGNHDSKERLNFLSPLFEENGLFLCAEIKKDIKKVTLTDEFGDVNFYLLPFLSPHEASKLYPEATIKTYDDAYKKVLEDTVKNLDKKARNILVGHGVFSVSDDKKILKHSESEITIGGSEMVDASFLKDFDYIALGHLHSSQAAGMEKMRYAGSILKYSKSEATQRKGVPLLTLGEKEDLKIELKKIKPLRDLRIIKGNFQSVSQPSDTLGLSNDDYIFVELEEKEPIIDAVSKLRAIYPNIMGVSYTAIKKSDSNIIKSEKIKDKTNIELFADFYKYITGEIPDDEQAAIVTKTIEELGKESDK